MAMAKAWAVIGINIVLLSMVSCQNATVARLGKKPFENHGVCLNMFCNSLSALRRLKDCVVVLGFIRIAPILNITKEEFRNMSFPKLREVTGHLVLYRVMNLESLGQLFPNLARIRGEQLFGDYALIVFDMPHLREVGLYSLLRIDRGGVIVLGGPQTCYVRSVAWRAVAPHSRHVLVESDDRVYCGQPCRCSRDPDANHCWNNKKCQRFVTGPEAEVCHPQCLGCRRTDATDCALCRHYTYRSTCVPACPNNTIVLQVNQYCLTRAECGKLDGWAWRGACVTRCPLGHRRQNLTDGSVTCVPCDHCQETCPSLVIQTITAIEKAEGCVFINGSLTIHIRAIPEWKTELGKFLNRIQEISDYLVIYGSLTITSLDFLSSLKRIRGVNLKNGKYSLAIYDMMNLQTLFAPDVTKHLVVDRGTINMHDNPLLCKKYINELQAQFPRQPDFLDVPQGLNGYSGGCDDAAIGLEVRVLNETAALVVFTPVADKEIHYNILYVRVEYGAPAVVPEACSSAEWSAVSASASRVGIVELAALRPASFYAVCIETYDPKQRHLARSSIVNFSTPVGKPEPPFILELVAASYDVIVIRWVNHKDYRPYITHYELDVSLVEIFARDVVARDHCNDIVETFEVDISRHAVVMRPPLNYEEGCETMCGVLSSVLVGTMVEDNFDICSSSDFECNVQELRVQGNSTYQTYVRTLVVNINASIQDFQVGGLAPFRDYRFQIRACVGNVCSRSARGSVRTLAAPDADRPGNLLASATPQGDVTVEWKPPNVTNGPVLTYTLQVTPNVNVSNTGYLMPQTWCVLSNITQLKVKSVDADRYWVRVCASTLASLSVCCEWVSVASEAGEVGNTYAMYKVARGWWLSGILFGVVLYLVSSGIGWLWRRGAADTQPLLDSTASQNETDPAFSDFEAFYCIPLHELRI